MSYFERVRPIDAVKAAAAAVSEALGSSTYAVVGGAACVLLGSTRETEDIDLVVPKGGTASARSQLAAMDKFLVDKRTRHTYFDAETPVEIEILAPPGLFKEPFDEATPTLLINQVKVLKPTLLLNAKCRSIISRSDVKRQTDSEDVKFLLRWLATNNQYPTSSEVPNAYSGFVEWFIASYGDADLWPCIGFDEKTGTFMGGPLDDEP